MSKNSSSTKLPLASLSITDDKLARLRELLPEVFAEGKVDFKKLEQALGEQVETSRERYGLNWAGKSEAIRALQMTSHGTLLPCHDESVNFDATENLIIEGDNLEVLKLLQKSYYGKIKMIYIDPPYNTGNDFVYADDFRDTLNNYLRYSGQIDEEGNATTSDQNRSGRFHSNWLNMMYPRLYLARNLLRDDGVIFVSIDDNEVHNLRLLMNEIFGEENFVGLIAVQLNPRGRHLDKFFAKTHEYIVAFAKNCELNPTQGIDKDERMASEYKLIDDRGLYREIELRNRNPAFNSKTRPNLFFPIWVSPTDNSVSIVESKSHSIKVLPLNSSGEESCWTWGKNKVSEEEKSLHARQTNGFSWRIFRKDYLIDKEGNTAKTLPKTVWLDKDINNDYGKKAIQDLLGSTVFDFPKAPNLIKKLLEIGNTSENIVIDFFGGSGTTAQAVMELNEADGGNRKFILVQLPEKTDKTDYPTIAHITRERVRRVIQKIETARNETSSQGSLLDNDENKSKQALGFRALRLDTSNFKIWNSSQAEDSSEQLAKQLELHANNMNMERSEQDVLFELILKTGLPLGASIETISFAKQSAFRVQGDGRELLICLEKAITQPTLDAIRLHKPDTLICLDLSFAGNDSLKTNTVLQMRDAGICFYTV